MTRLGLPVPPGFTISTDVCSFFYQNHSHYPIALKKGVETALKALERQMKRGFGDARKPLLVSVRSGAPASMPGMMDTILNLGLNDETVLGLAEQSKDERFALDSYRRFIAMYSDVVLGIHASLFEGALEELKHQRGVEEDTALTAADLKELTVSFKDLVASQGHVFPSDPMEQLWGAVGAVFKSWMSPRARTYRKLNSIPENWGTAVNVQAMVFGNMGMDCATGVAFTRDPSIGERIFFGEFLPNAQGEDVVAGIRTPFPINDRSRVKNSKNQKAAITLERLMPKAYKELVRVYQKLEKHYRDMQDIEFTIERGKLYMLQTRNGKRTAQAALRIAVEMVEEKLISKSEAILSVHPEQLNQLLLPCLDPKAEKKVLARGLPASPGAATGQIAFDPDTAERWATDENRKVILVRVETSPEDIHGMSCSLGILTARGGMTSHAAVVARGMGKCCVAGCAALKIDFEKRECEIAGTRLKEGDLITLDGSSGEVMHGSVKTIEPSMNAHFKVLMGWVDEVRSLGVRANADTPHDAQVARGFGAEGIGLCRTEHMFFDSDRIDTVRAMILADNERDRSAALEKILPMQRQDFLGIFRAMRGLPVTIRLLDPPLHEFIPHGDSEIRELAVRLGLPFDRLKHKAESLREFNPMLGHRGCRLAVSFPEIYRMQVTAVIEAACETAFESRGKKKNEATVLPEIMIPLVGDWRELEFTRSEAVTEAERVIAAFREKNGDPKFKLAYTIGTMIELPRAALTAFEIAKYADFFSFGTNDLTQTTYGLSRDDSGMFLKDYVERKIYERDPFVSLDVSGVGRLMEIACTEGRKSKRTLKLGICGEHGGDPQSIEFCQKLGLDYVSCSPFRVPIARLSAAQAALRSVAARAKK